MQTSYALTKVDLAALRQMDDLIVHRDRRNDGTMVDRVECVKKVEKSAANPWTDELRHIIPAPVSIRAGAWNNLDISQATAFAMMSNYKHELTTFTSALATLRVGDVVSFEFYPDYWSNGYVDKAGLHGDSLRLHVRRGDKHVAVWEIDHSMCQDNTARMVRSVRPNRVPEYALITSDAAA